MITTFSYSPGGSSKEGLRYKFANINGKTYQILRGYELNHQKIWLQVAGSSALKVTDLGKPWEVDGAKGFYIAGIRRYFHYRSERAVLQLCFIGNTTVGSRFLSLKFMAQRYGLELSDPQISELAILENPCWESHKFGTRYLDDLVSEDKSKQAVFVDFQILDWENRAKEMMDEIQGIG
jgi:hypothetical protein